MHTRDIRKEPSSVSTHAFLFGITVSSVTFIPNGDRAWGAIQDMKAQILQGWTWQ